MADVYRIRDWDKHFEISQSKRINGALNWVPVPTRHDGKGYRRLVRMDVAYYGVWVGILSVAAKCPERGVLADEDGPLTIEDIAIKTDMPEDLISEAMEVLCSSSIGWIVRERSGCAPSGDGDGSESTPSTGEDSTEQVGQESTEQELVEIWNQTKGVCHVRSLNDSRKRALRTRLKDPSWDWRAALAKFPLKVQRGSDWKPNIDWFLRPKSVNAILEGKYDFVPNQRGSPSLPDAATYDPSNSGATF